MNEIEDFIEGFKKKHKYELEDTFLNGYCYWFTIMLIKRFRGEIWFNEYTCHFAAYINGDLYDISGKLPSKDGWTTWEKFQLEHHYEAVQIERYIVRKEKKPDDYT